MTDTSIEEAMRAHLDNLTKPRGALGKLEDYATRLAVIQGKVPPRVNKKAVYVFGGDHGITEQGVSLYPSEVSYQMAINILAGGAGINALASGCGWDVFMVDAGIAADFPPPEELPKAATFVDMKIGQGTRNFLREDAMTEDELRNCMASGAKLATDARERGYDLVAIGDLGIGNTTTAAALVAALGIDETLVVDRGTGIDEEALQRKREAVHQALLARGPFETAEQAFKAVGGYDLAMMAGFILGLRGFGIGCVLDGFPVSSAAYGAWKIDPTVADFLFAGHRSKVKGHGPILAALGLEPILSLDMRLGEGTGAVLGPARPVRWHPSHPPPSRKGRTRSTTINSAGVPPGKGRTAGPLDRFLTCFTLVSRIPIPRSFVYDPSRMDFYLPLVGVPVSILTWSILLALRWVGFGASLAAIAVIIVQYLAFNLFHLDGLMDSADALLGLGSRERKLEILKDSRIGVYAFFAGFSDLCLKVVLMVTATSMLEEQWSPGKRLWALAFFMAAPVVGRLAASLIPCRCPNARPGGLGAVSAGSRAYRAILGAITGLLAIVALAVGVTLVSQGSGFATLTRSAFLSFGMDLGGLVIGSVGCALSVAMLVARAYSSGVGGYTGDALGAAIELGELAFLSLAILILRGWMVH